jgi:peptidoglycan/LPS O-acetylase OafA/YrhL
LFPFEALAWGGLFAWLVHSRNEFWPRLIGHPVSQVVSWGALVAWQVVPIPPLYNWHYQLPIAGLLYGLAVWNIGSNPRTLIGLRAEWLNKFGALTYGIYMWHVLVILAVFNFVNAYDLKSQLSPWLFEVVLFTSVIGLTMLVAQISFTWLEMPFLNLKNRWFGHAPANPPQGTLPTLASIASVSPGRANDDGPRRSGSRAA